LIHLNGVFTQIHDEDGFVGLIVIKISFQT